ncbi:sulfurtransferase complex subunit TusB [Candidatus Pantoea persica]|uniref:sulfurtransferase complex subunit TusB n=1 Tax=Candidatus Pantoea persica TaxID=2518128 RepID=UPI00215D9D6E|nr:sulfurtransferase complex subunit TusB [Candidatus Pantoea persica]MBA2817576.1 tRNA 2-thiouridine synthesizing protein B [Candidatus Pantoea persica]
MLHTLMHSPYYSDLDSLLQLLNEEDDLLLLQDGVLGALEGSQVLNRLLASPATLWVLTEDVTARGLSAQISTKVMPVDYTGFVTLTEKHQQQMTW